MYLDCDCAIKFYGFIKQTYSPLTRKKSLIDIFLL